MTHHTCLREVAHLPDLDALIRCLEQLRLVYGNIRVETPFSDPVSLRLWHARYPGASEHYLEVSA